MIRSLSIRTILFLLLFFMLPMPVKALDILVLPTVIDQAMDAWQHVPASSEPTLYPTARIYRGQSFRLLVLGKDYATDTLQNTDVAYTVQIFDPNGKKLLGQGSLFELYKGKVSNNTSLLLSQQYLTLDFSASDPFGTYRFEVTARDLLAGLDKTAAAEIVLAPVSERPTFDSPEAFSQWLTDYYRAPDPARAITALMQYVDIEPQSRLKQVPLLTFLSRVFQNNLFLWPYLKSIYAKGDSSERKKILLICALTEQEDDVFFSSLAPDFADYYQDAKKINLPVPLDRPATELEIDILWAEFVATGTISPIRKLVGALYLESARGTQDRLDSGDLEMTPEVKTRLVQEQVYHSALSTLVYNGERHSLVKQYLGYIYDLEHPEPAIKVQLEGILEILHQRANEEEARKHLEKQNKEP